MILHELEAYCGEALVRWPGAPNGKEFPEGRTSAPLADAPSRIFNNNILNHKSG